MQQCKDNANYAQFIPLEIKDSLKLMAMEQGLYEQVVKLHRKGFKFIASNKNENESKFKFQGIYARSQHWFDIYFN